MDSARPLNVGLIGYGVGGAYFHAPLIAAHPDLELRAVVTANPQRRERVAAEHPGTALVGDLDSLLAGAHDLDLVVVASPNRLHSAHAEAALDAGLPVVVDKPITATAAEARRLAERADRAGLMLTAFHNRRWDGDFRTARAVLESGELGRVHRFESRIERWAPEVKQTWRDAGGADEAAGLLYDLGSHLIDQAVQLFGPVSAVYAEADRRRPGARADDDTFLALSHRCGTRSHLWMSKVAARSGPRFRLLGSAAEFTKYGTDPQEAELRAGRRPVDRSSWGAEPEQQRGVLGTGSATREIAGRPGDYPAFYDGVVQALRQGSAPPVDVQQAVEVLDIIGAAHRSEAEATVEHLL